MATLTENSSTLFSETTPETNQDFLAVGANHALKKVLFLHPLPHVLSQLLQRDSSCLNRDFFVSLSDNGCFFVREFQAVHSTNFFIAP